MKLTPLAHQADAHEDGAWSVAWTTASDGSELLLTGSVDETVKSWRASDAGGLELVHSYAGHTLGCVSLTAAPNGLVASSALDSLIRVWDCNTHETAVVIECPPAENWKLAFAPGDAPARLACAAGASESVKLYALDDADTASEPKAEYKLPVRGDGEGARKGKGNFAHSIAFSPDGASLACGAADGRVAIFDVASGKVARTLEGHSMPVRDLVFSPDGRTLYTACDDGHAHAYDAHHGSLLDALPGHKSWVLAVAATSDGRGLVTVGADAKTKLWDVAQRQCVQTATEQGQAVWGVSVSAGKVACVSDDKSVCLYEYAE